MLEKYVRHVLDTKLDHIVECFDKEAVNISAWKGEVSLKNIVLKSTTLDAFGVFPFEIAYGKVGSLELQIPWSSLRSKSSSIVLTDVSLLLIPRRSGEKKHRESNKTDQNDLSKEQRIQAQLNKRILRQSITKTSKRNHLARLLSWLSSSLFSNLSVTIRNIHIRYEDTGSSLGFKWNEELSPSSFAVGLTLHQFSVQRTEIADQDTTEDDMLARNYKVRRKVAAVYQLAMYWDHGCPLIAVNMKGETDTTKEREHAGTAFLVMQEGITPQMVQSNKVFVEYRQSHSYVVQPISPSFQLNLVSGTGVDLPRSSLTMSLPPCELIVSRTVLESVAYLRKSVALWKNSMLAAELTETLNHLDKMRPLASPTVNSTAWWRYIIEATILLGRPSGKRRRRIGWSAFAYAVVKREKYVSLYQTCFKEYNSSSSVSSHSELCRLEEELSINEIAAFRFTAYESMLRIPIPILEAEVESSKEVESEDITTASTLSLNDRYQLMVDALPILRQRDNIYDNFDNNVSEKMPQESASLNWKTSLYCSEMALQVNSCDSLNSVKPIARLSFACVQHQLLDMDGAWELDATIADVNLVDMDMSGSQYPILIGPKKSQDTTEDDFVVVSGSHFRRCMKLQVQRSFIQSPDGLGSQTHSVVRLHPLEVVYSTNPVARLANIFSSIRTPELAGDYQRMASMVSQWKETQRKRLLRALAHKQKTITVDIDVSAPVILIPEDLSQKCGPTLVIDLGRVQLRNAERNSDSFDDVWSLNLSEMQLQNSTYSKKIADMEPEKQQIIEPFSLEFTIATSIASRKAKNNNGTTSIKIDASLPRLVFNLKTSSIRLVTRLQHQWNHMRKTADSRPIDKSHNPSKAKKEVDNLRRRTQHVDQSQLETSWSFQFLFSAPIIAMKLENDVDGCVETKSRSSGKSIFNLALRGIGGNYLQHVRCGSSFLEFEAKMRSLEAVDLFQQAGPDFALLLSSVSPSFFNNSALHTLADCVDLPSQSVIDTDLVSVKYELKESDNRSSSLSVKFHELFVEWNPETIAAIHKAAQLPMEEVPLKSKDTSKSKNDNIVTQIANSESEDEFFDAVESASFCSVSEQNVNDSLSLLSEISSSKASLAVEDNDFENPEQHLPTPDSSLLASPARHAQQLNSSTFFTPSSPTMYWKANLLQPWHRESLSPIHYSPFQFAGGYVAEEDEESVEKNSEFTPFEITFELSRLRVAFNKESRHRRLFVAEMDNTSIRHNTKEDGGSKTHAKMGNLIFIDPAAVNNTTLYSQILGLKTTTLGIKAEESSLLEMEFVVNNKERKYEPQSLTANLFIDPQEEVNHNGVTINTSRGKVTGCNYCVNLRFSPMRFVYLQQLWFEIIDYFFEGITGYEVWGRQRPKKVEIDQLGTYINPSLSEDDSQILRKPGLLGSDAAGINFTLFQIFLDAPEVLLPVEYMSPQFIRVTCKSLEVSNKYRSCVHQMERGGFNIDDRVQWYNTCKLHFQYLRLQSWCGTDLNKGGTGTSYIDGKNCDANVELSWPTGPTAKLVSPKWRVRCFLDEIDLMLRSQDYSLFQHIILYNIGEPSRNLDEWKMFQKMTAEELKSYKSNIMVHYGYDDKDTAPSTYDVEVTAPALGFDLLKGSGESGTLAQAKGTNFVWTLKKMSDSISHQKLMCNFKLSRNENIVSLPLLLPTSRGTALDGRPDIIYTSTSKLSGDNVKTLEVINAGINLIPHAWMETLAFFSDLGEPWKMTSNEMKNSLQVGDRWYPIGCGAFEPKSDKSKVSSHDENLNKNLQSKVKLQFRLLLDSPRIVLESETDGNSVILHMDHLEYLQLSDSFTGLTCRTFFVHNLELYTVSNNSVNRDTYSVENSLISPWSLLGSYETCSTGGELACNGHSMKITAEILKARAAYSDMTIALDVGRRLARDIKNHSKPSTPMPLLKKKGGATTSFGSTKNNVEDLKTQKMECSKQSNIASILLDGVDVLVVDDSRRHFARAQELISLSLGRLVLVREEALNSSKMILGSDQQVSDLHCVATMVVARITSLDLVDRLQATSSPFSRAASCKVANSTSNKEETFYKNVFEWQTFSSGRNKCWGFDPSSKLLEVLESQHGNNATFSALQGNAALKYETFILEGVRRKHKVDVGCISMQWNPSTVIALQRFLGRLLKEVRGDMSLHTDNGIKSSADDLKNLSPVLKKMPQTPLEAVFCVGQISLCLNKEHQNRRLLKMTLTGSQGEIAIDALTNRTYRGRVEDVQAWDEDSYTSAGIAEENRSVIRVLGKGLSKPEEIDLAFFEFQYSTFSDRNMQTAPAWVRAKIGVDSPDGEYEVDDHLSITMASVQFTYIRSRTDELIDYLSNGLPGKGMGVTKKAAKGFINKRIQTRSFLDLTIAAPQLRIPQHEMACNGVVMRLGDLQLRTWFELDGSECDEGSVDWCRALSVSIVGLGWNTYYDKKLEAIDDLSINLEINLRKPVSKRRAMELQGSLSFVVMLLKYSDYCLLRAILCNNIGRKPDVSKWDNVEKAYWLEEAQEDDTHDENSQEADRVAYSSSARIIRYGTKGRLQMSKEVSQGQTASSLSIPDQPYKILNFNFHMDGINLTLHRDDDLDAEASSDYAFDFHYDIVLLKVESVEVTFTKLSDGDTSFQMSLSQIGLFDKGDLGRLARKQYVINLATLASDSKSPLLQTSSTARRPCAFSVIAEGYLQKESNPGNGSENSSADGLLEPQLLLTVDTCPASAVSWSTGTEPNEDFEADRITVARIVLNYLSVNAMIRPLREVASFVSCAWPTKRNAIHSSNSPTTAESPKAVPLKKRDPKLSSGFQLKLIAHYPRIFFVADESDPKSRALVLRGLAVVNATVLKQSMSKVYNGEVIDEVEHSISLDANLQSMESFINPDASIPLGVMSDEDLSSKSCDVKTLGVALIQPVTAGIEYYQVSKERFPTIRSLNVSMEPVSTMLSFEDLSLINEVLERWKTEGTLGSSNTNNNSHTDISGNTFEVIFQTSRLGLELKNSADGVVVDRIVASTHNNGIRKGDILLMVNGVKTSGLLLDGVVELLGHSPRPMTATFLRKNVTLNGLPEFNSATNEQSADQLTPTTSMKSRKDHLRYKLRFRMGFPSGITVQQSHKGNIPIITEVNFSMISKAVYEDVGDYIDQDGSLQSSKPEQIKIPKTGAAIVAVGSLKAVDLGFEETLRLIEEFNNPSHVSDRPMDSEETSFYTLSFLELTSDDWGYIDTVDACISGIALTFIDDFQGRDMPLFRGKVNSIEIRCERGVGLHTESIDTATASVFGSVATAIEKPKLEEINQEANIAVKDLAREMIAKLALCFQAEIDYYHPRIAVWEPLLEPSQLSLALVWKPGICTGLQKRPGQVAFEITDNISVFFPEKSRLGSLVNNGISLNISDAAAEVTARTLFQLRNWKENSCRPKTIKVHPPSEYIQEHSFLSTKPAQGGTELQNYAGINKRERTTSDGDVSRGNNSKRIAARQAAQAALLFAEKRGAAIQEKGESAKPFIFRNLCGMDLSFCEQRHEGNVNSNSHKSSFAMKRISSDQEAKFQMEVANLTQEPIHSEGSKKIRSYEGRFPPLFVQIESLEDVFLDPLVGLQVSKVGIFVVELGVRRRKATNEESKARTDPTRVALPLLWKVELEDNRRILTLSSAIQITPIALGLSLDLGYSCGSETQPYDSIKILASIESGKSYFLPVWMSLNFQQLQIYIRPSNDSSDDVSLFKWGTTSVLRYERENRVKGGWSWREGFEAASSFPCDYERFDDERSAAWLTCTTSPTSIDDSCHIDKYPTSGPAGTRHHDFGMISILVDSSMSLRNMLPVPLHWELADATLNRLDGSSIRGKGDNANELSSGKCLEIFACDLTLTDVNLRLRPTPTMAWTNRAHITLPNNIRRERDPQDANNEENFDPPVRQINVHTVDDFGCPLHFGIRLTPKLHRPLEGRSICYGLDIFVFAELWFRNLTKLPVTFGCPWSEMCPSSVPEEDTDDLSVFETASKAAAEAALIEIASVLEFGDKGRGLANVDQESIEKGNFHNIPLQASNCLCHEVFEYIEVESSTVKRRWWASEQYDNIRLEPESYKEIGSNWDWIDGSWMLDFSGNVKESEGGWESCRSLFAGESYFARSRNIDPTHIFRRRRWFRRQRFDGQSIGLPKDISCFYQPSRDSFSRREARRRMASEGSGIDTNSIQEGFHRISLRNSDGQWSPSTKIPLAGPSQGIARVHSSRWPTISSTRQGKGKHLPSSVQTTLKPELYELCYSVSDLPGDWGEFSRLVTISPRFLFRNDSAFVTFEAKQTGVPDSEAIRLSPGNILPFYWTDFRLPQLVSVRPIGCTSEAYRWSGGFDICSLGTIPLRIRSSVLEEGNNIFSVRALVEIRPSSSGLNISFKEEDKDGSSSLFRIENHSPFPIWISQDGVLANPSIAFDPSATEQNEIRRRHDQVHNLSDRPPEIDGDVILPCKQKAFALDVPFRQGKYATRKAATLEELLRVRIGLAPLSTRDGIETTKVISFTTVGAYVRLKPEKLRPLYALAALVKEIRILGVIVTDGPARVLRFVLITKENTDEDIDESDTANIGYKSSISSPRGSFQPLSRGEQLFCQVSTKAALEALELKQAGKVCTESIAKREAFLNQEDLELESENQENDIVFSVRSYFSGVLLSLVDSAPSEIAVVSIKGVETVAKWNKFRTGDASACVSIAWLQVDNHIPNAPYPVAVCPHHVSRNDGTQETSENLGRNTSMLLMSFKFAPKHQSGILCLRSATIAPSNLAIAIDLALIVRLQGLVTGLHDHFVRDKISHLDLAGFETIAFPDLVTSLDKFSAPSSESQKLYFEGITIAPSNINLSVAPARALTPVQAHLEGREAAAIHAAVRKGDVRLADGGMVGVTVGRKNHTAMAVVRGVWKSIIVDALLRLDGASLHLSGISLWNHVSTVQQMKTYLTAHYLSNLRSNVPALLGSLAAFGNPVGLIRGIGDGVSDFVNEPVKGLKRSVEELDPVHVVDGVARGTESLYKNTVGGIAESASMLTETLSQNMAVLTLDRRYAQRRDIARSKQAELNFVEGIESGVAHLVGGVIEGVTGVVKAPLRGAERSGVEGFAKGIGKGLLGLLVKPMIGLSDAATDVMIGVKGSVDGGRLAGRGVHGTLQVRPRRTMYGKDRTIRAYSLADAAASSFMLRTKLAGENYSSHLDMGDKVLLVSQKRFVLLGSNGEELLLAKFKHVRTVELISQKNETDDQKYMWNIMITIWSQRMNDIKQEIVSCGENKSLAIELVEHLRRGLSLVSSSDYGS